MKKTCVIGWPIEHSRSPLIHNYWMNHHGIASFYERKPVEPSHLHEFVRGLPGSDYLGCNVTLPHKKAVLSFLDEVDERTHKIGAVNTISVRGGRLIGTNTDGEGFLNNLKQSGIALNYKTLDAVILGAGGAALAVIAALLEKNVRRIRLINRTMERALAIRETFGERVEPVPWARQPEVMSDCGLLVNSTSLGMHGQPALAIDLRGLPQTSVVTDLVYVPLETDLLAEARRRGNPVVGGLGMLIHQAVKGFELWYGVRPEVTPELYDIVARDIVAGYHR
jgi:shikimate dehydrogenase